MAFDPPLYLIGFTCGLASGMLLIAFIYRGHRRDLMTTISAHERTIAAHNLTIHHLRRREEQQARSIHASRKAVDVALPPRRMASGGYVGAGRPVLGRVGEQPSSSGDDLALGMMIGSVIVAGSEPSRSSGSDHHHSPPSDDSSNSSSSGSDSGNSGGGGD